MLWDGGLDLLDVAGAEAKRWARKLMSGRFCRERMTSQLLSAFSYWRPKTWAAGSLEVSARPSGPPQAFRFGICGEIHEAVAPNGFGVHEIVIPGGRCVVVRHARSPDHIGETIYPIYRDWLPASGEELRDQPLLFHYLSVYPETPQDQWQTDVYVPLQ